jgi:hypothetical protein
MSKYEALAARVAEWTESKEGKAVIRSGKAFGRKVKAARFAASPAIAAEREQGVTKDVLADEYGMSTGSVGNYAALGILMLADESVDPQAAYTYVTKNEGAPNLAEIRQAADERLTAGKGDVLAMLTAIVDARLASDQTPGDPDEGDEGDTPDESGKAAVYYAQATDALVNLLRDGTDVSGLTMDEVQTLAAQVAALADRVRKAAAPKAA